MEGLIIDKNLNKFLDKFVKIDYEYNNINNMSNLFWCNFNRVGKVYDTEKLFKSKLTIEKPVYFYDEFTEEMYRTDFKEVRSFIDNLEPWDEVDAEIFDDSLEWVIAITHEDISIVLGLNVDIEEYDYEKDMQK